MRTETSLLILAVTDHTCLFNIKSRKVFPLSKNRIKNVILPLSENWKQDKIFLLVIKLGENGADHVKDTGRVNR